MNNTNFVNVFSFLLQISIRSYWWHNRQTWFRGRTKDMNSQNEKEMNEKAEKKMFFMIKYNSIGMKGKDITLQKNK